MRKLSRAIAILAAVGAATSILYAGLLGALAGRAFSRAFWLPDPRLKAEAIAALPLGASRHDVVAALGEPTGETAVGPRVVLEYAKASLAHFACPHVWIALEADRVTDVEVEARPYCIGGEAAYRFDAAASTDRRADVARYF
jgi:hypothetical protein